MTDTTQNENAVFPRIEPSMVDRLVNEADERTIKPQHIDWTQVHLEAQRVRERKNSSQ